MPLSWPTERIVVTGGAGLLGAYVRDALRGKGAREVFVPTRRTTISSTLRR
jgi:nucleoside-diphosphate-sugar epimerase